MIYKIRFICYSIQHFFLESAYWLQKYIFFPKLPNILAKKYNFIN